MIQNYCYKPDHFLVPVTSSLKSFMITPKICHSLLLLFSFQKTCHFIPVHISLCGQNQILRHITDQVNFKNTMQQGGIETIRIPGNQITQHWISPSSGYPGSSPRNTSCYPPTTDIPRYQSVIPISISMVNSFPRMNKLLSSTESVFTQQVVKFPISKSLGSNHCNRKPLQFGCYPMSR